MSNPLNEAKYIAQLWNDIKRVEGQNLKLRQELEALQHKVQRLEAENSAMREELRQWQERFEDTYSRSNSALYPLS